MRTNTANPRETSPSEPHRSGNIADIKILRPDGSWKPIAACVAAPEQFEATLSPEAIEHFISRARQSNLALERVITAIRRSWGD